MPATEDQLRSFYSAIPDDLDACERLQRSASAQAGANGRARTDGRNRKGAIVGVLATATVLIAVFLVSGPLRPHHTQRPGGATAVPTSPTLLPTATTPAPSPSSTPSPTLVRASPQVIVHTLASLLAPHGTVDTFTGRTVDDQAGGELVFNDGLGRAAMYVWLTPGPDESGQGDPAPTTCAQVANLIRDTCTSLPNGDLVTTLQTYEYPSRADRGAKQWLVTLYRRDGLQIDISEFNAPTEKDSPATRADPPFTIADLSAIAMDPHWTSRVDPAMNARWAHLFTPDVMPS